MRIIFSTIRYLAGSMSSLNIVIWKSTVRTSCTKASRSPAARAKPRFFFFRSAFERLTVGLNKYFKSLLDGDGLAIIKPHFFIIYLLLLKKIQYILSYLHNKIKKV